MRIRFLARVLALLCVVCLLFSGCEAVPIQAGGESASHPDFTLPASLQAFDPAFALSLLSLCTSRTVQETRSALEGAGFTPVTYNHYDKDVSDRSHSCAFMIGKRTLSSGTASRVVLLVTVRATNGGEWYANFDFAPSHSEETLFAENFLLAAQEIFGEIQQVAAEDHPLIVLTGHSRGGALANLLGMLCNEAFGEENVCAYTFGAPATVRGAAAHIRCPNIFNVINQSDIVTQVPLTAWGFTRAGVDISFCANDALAQKEAEQLQTLTDLSPDISTYYKKRYALECAGESADGLTVYEACLLLIEQVRDRLYTPRSTGGVSLSEDSGLYPLFSLCASLGEDAGSGALTILMQHMPATYQRYLRAMVGQNS